MADAAPDAPAHKLNSSLRSRPLHETLALAKKLAPARGISRVTDTTPLDRIGIPVFASTRPGAAKGVLCVHAGKGLLPDEARVGAYMEALEHSYAEEDGTHVPFFIGTVGEMLASYRGALSFGDFCPLMGHVGADADAISLVKAELVGAGREVLVPAELVYLPFSSITGEARFGYGTSCGLASGNSVDEASVHALAEIIEHDIAAFEFIKDTSRLVDQRQLPGAARSLVDKMEAAGFHVFLRYMDNAFGMPYFHAILIDRSPQAAVNICAGYGVHPLKDVAAVRALAEAAQSRLSTIHGGRDDLSKYPETWRQLGREAELKAIADYRDQAADRSNMVDYDAIGDWSAAELTIASAWRAMVDVLASQGIEHIARVVLTEPGSELHVVKLIVPKMEACEADAMRFGPRLRAYVNSL